MSMTKRPENLKIVPESSKSHSINYVKNPGSHTKCPAKPYTISMELITLWLEPLWHIFWWQNGLSDSFYHAPVIPIKRNTCWKEKENEHQFSLKIVKIKNKMLIHGPIDDGRKKER